MQITTNYFDNVGNIDSLTDTTLAANAGFQYDAFNRLTKATYPEKIYDYAYDPFGNMLTAQENSVTVFSKGYTAANRVSGYGYDGRGNLTQGDGLSQVWDKRNRLSESRTATNALLGSYVYNERGLRVKAERSGQPMVQVVAPNGGESFYLGAMDTVSWNGMGLAGALVKLELLVGGTVAGTIAENLPGTQTNYQWQAGKMLSGWATPGTDLKVRVTAMVPPAASGTTYYFYDSGGRLLSEYDQTGVCIKDYLYLGGKMIGEYVPATSSYYYYASDQINSTRLVTDSTGAVVHSAQYDPYGGLYKTWVDTYHPKPGFSGKEREFGSEMDYFGARYYGHRQYRFSSVDPIITKENALENPQLWNLYSYCRNNPISYIDPDGRDTYVILYGQSGVSHNVKDLFKWAAETRITELGSSMGKDDRLIFRQVSTVEQFRDAVNYNDLKLIEYFGHGSSDALFLGDALYTAGNRTNIYESAVSVLPGKFVNGGKIQLNACNTAKNGEDSIAGAFADRYQVPVKGSTTGMDFVGTEKKPTHMRGNITTIFPDLNK